MPLLVPYNYLPDLGVLQTDDYVPVLRAPFQEGKAFVSDIIYASQPYTKIIGNISQSGALMAPTINIFENNTGATLTTSYGSIGGYTVTSDLAIFEENLTWIYIGNTQASPDFNVYLMTRVDNYNLNIWTGNNGSLEDSLMNNTSFEIRIYPNPAP